MTEASVTNLSEFRGRRRGASTAPLWPVEGMPTPPPSGTVTFLLTDVEGSTPRWEAAPDAMAEAIGLHYELLNGAVDRFGGVRPVEQGEGDSMVAAFTRASDAVAAALVAQRALASAQWPDGADLTVRMALHTGEARLRENTYYVGPSIIRTARLRSLGHGGQVLVSTTTADLLAGNLPDEATLVPLGTHRLKGMATPERVFQLVHPGLRAEFPPLHSLDAAPTNLPVQVSSFVGREHELAELADLMDRHRLLTLTGPGGTGKTRLAVEAAADNLDRFGDGLWWVDLAPVGDPALVPDAVMAALRLEAKGLDLMDRLTDYLAGRTALLVLDNCEHVLDTAARLVDRVLTSCPRVTLLATSREPLGLAGEHIVAVPPLSLPAGRIDQSVEDVLDAEAVQLFLERAVAARPAFDCDPTTAPTVAAICTQLDGIPLAIELAAARIRSLTPEHLLAGLTKRFAILTGSRAAEPRQQTLSASVAWSHDLLSDAERTLFRRLAAFTGSFDLTAAESVGEPLPGAAVVTVLPDLVDKSLVAFDGEDYRLLQTIREFAGARLAEAGEYEAARGAHLRHYRGVAAAGSRELEEAPQPATLARLEAVRGNILAAVEWALVTGDHDAALQIVGDMGLFWHLHGQHAESLALLRRVLDATPPETTPVRVRALWAAGEVGLFGMDMPGLGINETAAAVESAATTGQQEILCRALGLQGFLQMFVDPPGAGQTLARARSVAHEAGDRYGACAAAAYAAMAHIFNMDRADLAEPYLVELAAEAEATRSPYWASWAGVNRGVVAWRAGRLAEAARLLTDADELAWTVGEPVLESWCARWLADVHSERGDHAAAEAVIARSIGWQDRSSWGRLEMVLSRRIQGQVARGDIGLAQQTFAAVRAVLVDGGFLFAQAEAGVLGARMALTEGDTAAAREWVGMAQGAAHKLGTPWYLVHAADADGRVARAEGNPGAAEDAHHRALALSLAHGFLAVAAETLECLASLAILAESFEEGARLYGASGALREQTGRRRHPADEPTAAADMAALGGALPPDALGAATAAGAALTPAEAAAYAVRARATRKRPSTGWAALTPGELQVVALVADGLTNAQVGAALSVTEGTVKAHLRNIFGKLGIDRRTQLVALAADHGVKAT